MTLIQSLELVYRFLNLLIYSLVNNIAILVSKAVLLDKSIPVPGLIKPIAELPIAQILIQSKFQL